MTKISAVILLSTTLIAFVPIAYAEADTQKVPSENTQAFVQSARIGNQFEIASSRLALKNSHDDTIRQFAQQMIDDHTKALQELKTTLASEHPKPKQPAASLDAEHQDMADKLNKLSGADFDREYVTDQVAAHDDAAKLFSDYAQNGDDQPLKEYAAKTLPVIQKHQKHIYAISSSFSS